MRWKLRIPGLWFLRLTPTLRRRPRVRTYRASPIRRLQSVTMSAVMNQIMNAMQAEAMANIDAQASAKAAFDEAHQAHKLVAGKRRAAEASAAKREAEERRLAQQRARFDISTEGQVASVAVCGLAQVDLGGKRAVLDALFRAVWLQPQPYRAVFNVRMRGCRGRVCGWRRACTRVLAQVHHARDLCVQLVCACAS